MTLSKKREIDRKRRLTKVLDDIARERVKKRNGENKYSYVIHTPKEALKILGERSRSHLNEEDLKRNYSRIKKITQL